MSYFGRLDATQEYIRDNPGGKPNGPVGTIDCHHCGEPFHLSLPECPECSHKTLTWANPELCPPCASLPAVGGVTHIGPDLTPDLERSIEAMKEQAK